MTTALQIFEEALLGALIAYSNNEPRPPERFRRKLSAWKAENGVGRLVERSPGSDRVPATFTLHTGDFGGAGVIVMTMRRLFAVTSSKTFSIVETPKPGMVRVLTGQGDHVELRHLAQDMAAAEAWMATNRYLDMRAEVVAEPDAPPPAQDADEPRDEHYSAFQPSAEPMTPERVAELMADPEQGCRLRALIGGREFDDILVTAQDDDLSVIDALAGVLPLCRTMERTRNSVLQQRAHLRTWLGRGVAPSVNAGAGHIRWTKVAQGLSGKLGEFTVRYAGPAVGRGHLIRVELAGGQPATGFASAEGRLLDPEIRFSNKARMRGEMTAALRRFGGATRLGGAAQT